MQSKSENLSYRVMATLAKARTMAGYERAKRLAEGLETIEQMALIDNFIAARRRIGANHG